MTDISQTLYRLHSAIRLSGWTNLKKLYNGLALEFKRVVNAKNTLFRDCVPSFYTGDDVIADYNDKYGIPQDLPQDDGIGRIMDRASLTSSAAAGYIQEQLWKAGYKLYIVPLLPSGTGILRWGAFQYRGSKQYGKITNYEYNPNDIPGILIAGTHPTGGEWKITNNANYFGLFFILSPLQNGFVTSEDAFFELTQAQYNYLEKLIISLKHMKMWCIAQVKITP